MLEALNALVLDSIITLSKKQLRLARSVTLLYYVTSLLALSLRYQP